MGPVPDLFYPLTGWRIWRVFIPPIGSHSIPILRSVILDTAWTPRRRIAAEHNFDLRARCRGLLNANCSCGIYAFKEMSDALNYLMGVRDRWMGTFLDAALGTVNLWGHVVECERGFRSQYAYPRHIYLPAAAARQMMAISATFGISVGIHTSDCREEISVSPSPEPDLPWPKTVSLKRSGLLHVPNGSYETGFYDFGEFANPISQAS